MAPAFDWDDKGWARAWVLYIFIQLNFSIIYNHAFWTVGGLAKHPSEIIRFTSIVRGVEAAGGAVAGEPVRFLVLEILVLIFPHSYQLVLHPGRCRWVPFAR